MKILHIFTLCMGLLLSMSSTQRSVNLYQVTTSHPHDIEELKPYIETVHQSGRLWIVKLQNGAPEKLREHLSPLRGTEKSYLFNGLVIRNMSKSHSITEDVLSRVDKNLLEEDVRDLSLNYETRYVGTEENQLAIKNIASRLTDLDYKVSEICYHTDSCSLIAEKTGFIHPEKVILIEAHVDSVGEAFAGADDNASGIAVALEMARILKDVQNNKTIRFFISNGEERGLLGSEHYALSLQTRKEIKSIELVINMDMVGYNSNGIVELETEPEFEGLAKWYAFLAKRYTKLKPKITLGAWGSDHVPFLKRGVPSILTMEDWDTKTPCYHLECDTPETLNYDYMAEITKLNLSAVIIKDISSIMW